MPHQFSSVACRLSKHSILVAISDSYKPRRLQVLDRRAGELGDEPNRKLWPNNGNLMDLNFHFREWVCYHSGLQPSRFLWDSPIINI